MKSELTPDCPLSAEESYHICSSISPITFAFPSDKYRTAAMSPSPQLGVTHTPVKPHTTWINILTILAAGTASFNFGYSNNAIAGTLAQASFGEYFLYTEATSRVGGMLGA
jgi:hypothetical protein